jgi:hypothetical protein
VFLIVCDLKESTEGMLMRSHQATINNYNMWQQHTFITSPFLRFAIFKGIFKGRVSTDVIHRANVRKYDTKQFLQ